MTTTPTSTTPSSATAPTPVAEYYIPASISFEERRLRTLKHGDTFAMFDGYGDLTGDGEGPEGLYHQDTRCLSALRLAIERRRPLLLSSNVLDGHALMTVDLTNPDLYTGDALTLPKDTIHLQRAKFLWQGACHEAISLRNHGSAACEFELSLAFEADFRDLFEVRGQQRARRGTLAAGVEGDDRVTLRYIGLDQCVREVRLDFSPAPTRLRADHAAWRLRLAPGESANLSFVVHCGPPPLRTPSYARSLRMARLARAQDQRAQAEVHSSSPSFDALLARSRADLAMLVTALPTGPYPYAGIPWFSTAFGRDGIITAIEMLAFDPRLARGVLEFLAATQATGFDPARDAEPGKILHETRQGEMATLGEVPFGRYYGSVDSTPLFVLLAGLHHRRTGDLDTARRLWPHVLAALDWIDHHGDHDGDGFIEYSRRSANGLANHGWKDSDDSVFHADGELAQGAIALCEVQAYVFAAKAHCVAMARALGHVDVARRLEAEARLLRGRFEAAFWQDDLDTYALALDGDKRPCRVLSSNAGHALLCRIADVRHASRLARRLVGPQLFSGWGIRTIGSGERRFNPMSYHNGSVWPHDNAMIALGLARYGHADAALTVTQALIDTASHMDLQRLPELFCGFSRHAQCAPTAYPVACSPQAWASATPFALLTAVLGLQVDARTGQVLFRHPRLPAGIDELTLSNLRVGTATVDILLQRRGAGVAASVLRKQGPVTVTVVL